MVLAALLLTAAGCDTAAETLAAVTGSDLRTGGDASLPEGFPMDPPDGAILTDSIRTTAAGFETMTGQFVLPGKPADDVLAPYVQLMQMRGLNVGPRGDDLKQVLTGYGDAGEKWSAELTRREGGAVLVLSVVRPIPASPP
jgi:hypothetical protein